MSTPSDNYVPITVSSFQPVVVPGSMPNSPGVTQILMFSAYATCAKQVVDGDEKIAFQWTIPGDSGPGGIVYNLQQYYVEGAYALADSLSSVHFNAPYKQTVFIRVESMTLSVPGPSTSGLPTVSFYAKLWASSANLQQLSFSGYIGLSQWDDG